MSEDTTTKPSADDIVDDLAEEMGVDEDEITSEDVQDEEPDDSVMDGLGGVLGVSKGKKKKKSKKKAKKKKKKKKTANPAGVDDIFNPNKDDDENLGDYLGLDDVDEEPKNPVNKLLVGVIIVLIVGMGGVVYATTDFFDDFVLLVQGNYQEEKQRQVRQAEREHMEAQLAGMPRFGNLVISGNPQHALIKLNGEVQFGQPPESEQWRALRVGPGTAIQDLSIDTVHEVEVTAPGHEPRTFTVTEDMWRPHAADYFYEISATLTPAGSEAFDEFSTRMEMGGDVYTGTVDFVTVPEGAQILVNSRVALDEDGEEIRTPATLEKYWTYDEEEDELVERDFRVDMPPNRGNRVEVIIPDDDELPEYLMGLQRAMWECEWKDDAERDRLPASASIQDHCNYVFSVNVDFNDLKRYIEEQEAERERIDQQRREASGGAPPTEAAEAAEESEEG